MLGRWFIGLCDELYRLRIKAFRHLKGTVKHKKASSLRGAITSSVLKYRMRRSNPPDLSSLISFLSWFDYQRKSRIIVNDDGPLLSRRFPGAGPSADGLIALSFSFTFFCGKRKKPCPTASAGGKERPAHPCPTASRRQEMRYSPLFC